MKPRRAGLTLLELLVAVGIIAILAALAIPHLLEYQTRAKAARAATGLRTLITGLEAYSTDYSTYPSTRPSSPSDPFGIFAEIQLRGLTTPIAYVGSDAFRDPFGVVRAFNVQTFSSVAPMFRDGDFLDLQPPNNNRSLLYYHYPTLANAMGDRRINRFGAGVVSLGPDAADTLGAYRPFGIPFFVERFSTLGINHPLNTVYDPTNGTFSSGDISAFAGDAARFEVR